MNKKTPAFWKALACMMLTILACNLSKLTPPAPSAIPQAPTMIAPTATPPQIISPTAILPPVVENAPAPQVVIPPTQAEDPIMAEVAEYYSKGYLPYPNGQLTALPDFSFTQPGADIHDVTRTKAEAQDFALWADVELNTLGSETRYPNYTGCGFAYRAQSGTGYTAILTNTYVRMGACLSDMRQCELFGTIAGDGKVDVRNKNTVQFSLAVNKERAYAFVDGVLVGQYGLYTTRLQGTGAIHYDAVSNYGAGYWTTCQMTNVKLWESLP